MPMTSPRPARFVAATSLALLAGAAPAAVVFNDWTSVNAVPGNHQLTVIDTGSQFEWTLTITPWNAEALALFVDLGAVTMPSTVSLTNLIPTAPVSLVGRDTSSSSCGTGCNLNGLNSLPALAGGDWELVFRLGSTGFDGIQTYSWSTSDFGLGEGDIRLVGVRAQQLCGAGQTLSNGSANCGGSDKAWALPTSTPDFDPPPVPPGPPFVPPGNVASVPLPATPALVLLGAAAALAWRRRSSAHSSARYSVMR